MITFKSETDFEDAVMRVLKERLNISLSVREISHDYYGESTGTKVEIQLEDNGQPFSSASDYS